MKEVNKDNKFMLEKFDEEIFKKWESNYNENLANNFFGNWLKYKNFINVQFDKIRKKPIVMVFAGPSLDNTVQKLTAIREKITIMCVDVIVFKLLEHGIKPEIVVNVDPMNIMRFWDGWDGEGSVFIAPVTAHPENLKAWKGKKFLYNPVDFMFKNKYEALKKLTKEVKDFGNISNAGFVGATILQILKDIRPYENVFLMGADFGYTNNNVYCNGFLDRRYPGKGREKEKEMEFKKEQMVGTIWSSKTLLTYMSIFLQIRRNYNLKMTNCTEGGILTYSKEIENKSIENCMK